MLTDCRQRHRIALVPYRILSFFLTTALAFSLPGATVSWVGGSGNWLTATNWSHGSFPGPNDDVVIDVAGDQTVVLDAGTNKVRNLQCAEDFVLSGGTLEVMAESRFSGLFSFSAGTLTGAGDVSLTGTALWAGGNMTGSGRTRVVAPHGRLLLSGRELHLSRELVNAGTLLWAKGELVLENGKVSNHGNFVAGLGHLSGVAKMSLFRGIPGFFIQNLTNHWKFPDAPDEVRLVASADSGYELGDQYGGMLEFDWQPRRSGRFQLAIAADDVAQLWFDSERAFAPAELLATENGWHVQLDFASPERRAGCGPAGGVSPCENVTRPVQVSADGSYHVRGLWKEGAGGDHLAVAAQPAGEPFTTASRPLPADEIAYRWPQTDLVARAIGGTNAIRNQVGATVRITGSTKIRLLADGAELPFQNQGQLEAGDGAFIPSAR